MQAVGHVKIDAPQLTGEVGQLQTWFETIVVPKTIDPPATAEMVPVPEAREAVRTPATTMISGPISAASGPASAPAAAAPPPSVTAQVPAQSAAQPHRAKRPLRPQRWKRSRRALPPAQRPRNDCPLSRPMPLGSSDFTSPAN